MIEFDFPVSSYYKDNIIDARTINKTGNWWSAILVIQDPSNNKPFLNFYRWKKVGGDWKVRKSFSCRSGKDLIKITEILNEFNQALE